MIFPAGTYYVGDLCYALRSEWDEVCDLIIDVGHHDVREGQFCLKSGVRFAIYNTRWGDGVYHDDSGREYLVDAGCIGCVSLSDLAKLYHDEDVVKEVSGGQFIRFDAAFETYAEGGRIHIGDVVVDTDPQY